MRLENLMGRYFRLQQELAIAYKQQPWQAGRIDRVADDLAATEREIAALGLASRRMPGDGQGAADHRVG